MDSALQSAQLRDNTSHDQLGPIEVEDGYLQVTFTEGELPRFVIEANDAIKAGRFDQAAKILDKDSVEGFHKKIERDGCRSVVIFSVAKLLFDTGQFAQAEQWYRELMEREPKAFVYKAVADCCVEQGRYCEAVEYRRKAVEASPETTAYWLHLARGLIVTGKRDDGMQILRDRAAMTPPDDAARSILLWQLHHLPDSKAEMFFEQYRDWGRTFLPTDLARTSHDNEPDPDRRLRIGYVSPDFRKHVVSRSFEPFLDGHDRRRLEVFGYGNIARPDEITERFRRKFDHYRSIYGMSLKDAACLVEKDRIDILITIGGHCSDNSLGIMGFKPAPVQVDYGGINTSGIEQIDYRLTDRLATPVEMEKFYTEKSVCLPCGIFSYRPPRRSPMVGPLPAKLNGYVTFGSFNNGIKINSYTMELWARVLNAVPESRFLLKVLGAHDPELKEYYLYEFERLGVCRDRVDVYETLRSHFEHMDIHNKVDIMLDTYPFCGCMTTLEGLWMGVPTVSLVGRETALSRSGLTILSRVGLEIFAASCPDEYVAKASAFSKELDHLEKIRAVLRQRTLQSDLCNPKGFARNVEAAYRSMWRQWCKKQNATATV